MNALCKIFLLICTMILLWGLPGSKAQNLIPNGDFELGPDSTSAAWLYSWNSNCVVELDTVLGPDFWTVTYGTPDRVDWDDPDFDCGDNGPAQSGMSLILLGSSENGEGGKATLIAPLEAGTKYRLQYHIGLDTTYYSSPNAHPMGVIFKFNGGDSIVSPCVSNPGYGVWNHYDTTFTANQNSTEIEFRVNPCDLLLNVSFLKLDNIILEIDSPVSTNDISAEPDVINIYPNPLTNSAILCIDIGYDIKHCRVTLYNTLGERISSHEIKNKKLRIERAELPAGIYFLKIQVDNTLFTRKLLITN